MGSEKRSNCKSGIFEKGIEDFLVEHFSTSFLMSTPCVINIGGADGCCRTDRVDPLRQPRYHVLLIEDLGRWLCAPPFRVVCLYLAVISFNNRGLLNPLPPNREVWNVFRLSAALAENLIFFKNFLYPVIGEDFSLDFTKMVCH